MLLIRVQSVSLKGQGSGKNGDLRRIPSRTCCSGRGSGHFFFILVRTLTCGVFGMFFQTDDVLARTFWCIWDISSIAHCSGCEFGTVLKMVRALARTLTYWVFGTFLLFLCSGHGFGIFLQTPMFWWDPWQVLTCFAFGTKAGSSKCLTFWWEPWLVVDLGCFFQWTTFWLEPFSCIQYILDIFLKPDVLPVVWDIPSKGHVLLRTLMFWSESAGALQTVGLFVSRVFSV